MAIVTPLYTIQELDTLIDQWKAIERGVTIHGQHETTVNGETRRWTARNLSEINNQLAHYQNKRSALQTGRDSSAPQVVVGVPYRGNRYRDQ